MRLPRLKFPSPREIVFSLLPLDLSSAKDKATKGKIVLLPLIDLTKRYSVVSKQWENCFFTEWILLYKAESKHRSKLCCLKLH